MRRGSIVHINYKSVVCKCRYIVTSSLLLFIAVQNERDTISKRPRGEDTDNRHGLTTNVLLSAEILSRPATSPPGNVQTLRGDQKVIG